MRKEGIQRERQRQRRDKERSRERVRQRDRDREGNMIAECLGFLVEFDNLELEMCSKSL